MYNAKYLKKLLSSMLPQTEVLFAAGLINDLDSIVESNFPGYRFLLVCDRNIFDLLDSKFTAAHRSSLYVFEAGVSADSDAVDRLVCASRNYDLIVAIGSGTIGDLCKYASFISGKQYVMFPTAPSMNGYLSSTASIRVGGYKRSLPAHLPVGLFVDYDIITQAPRRLIVSGICDYMAHYVARNDWYMSSMLLGTAYDEAAFCILESNRELLLKCIEEAVLGDAHAVALLMEALVLSGLSMHNSGGSYPCSQGEHMIAHAIDMKSVDSAAPLFFHGEVVAVTVRFMYMLQKYMAQDMPVLGDMSISMDEVVGYYGSASVAIANNAQYKMSLNKDIMNDNIRLHWDLVRCKVLNMPDLPALFKKIGAPLSYCDLFLPAKTYRDAVCMAFALRDRFTFLDIMLRMDKNAMGILKACL